MKYKPLSQVAKYRTDRIAAVKITDGNYISTENMRPNRGGVEKAATVPISKAFSKYVPKDILLSNIRPYFKKIWFADQIGGCSNDVLVVHSNGVDAKFLYYVLSDNNFFNYSTVTAKGTKMPRGSKTAIMKYLVPDIDLLTQTRIASILSAYDDAIENNSRRIALLERAARELYREWFVRFRFPGHEKMKIVNGLPEGWALVRLSELYDTTSGGTPSRQYPEYYQNGIYPWIKTGELNNRFIIETEESITAEAIKKSSAKIIDDGSLIMAMYGATIGQLGFTVGQTTCNQACCVFIPKVAHYSKEYLFLWISHNLKHIIGLGFGAAQQNLSQELIARLNILKPETNIVQKFTDIVFKKYMLIKQLQFQSQNLARQRDLLLPRLMSGKLKV